MFIHHRSNSKTGRKKRQYENQSERRLSGKTTTTNHVRPCQKVLNILSELAIMMTTNDVVRPQRSMTRGRPADGINGDDQVLGFCTVLVLATEERLCHSLYFGTSRRQQWHAKWSLSVRSISLFKNKYRMSHEAL